MTAQSATETQLISFMQHQETYWR